MDDGETHERGDEMKLAIDFDGTCVRHEFPRVGADVPGAVPALSQLKAMGHELFLFTMRSGTFLTDAVSWFAGHAISLDGLQRDPTQTKWTDSPKCFASLYIDDAAYGAPLVYPGGGERPYLDWSGVVAHVNGCEDTVIIPLEEATRGRTGSN